LTVTVPDVETEDHPHRRRFTRTVRSEEAGDDAGSNRECEVVDSNCFAVPLRQVVCLDRVFVRPVDRWHCRARAGDVRSARG
jgi:hypothetical protein